ncbi:phosphatase [Roseibium aquae]|uniref:phosphoglycolate phosphatase n=1 Tax=Roseibium aquae TaxID=1323746 RepID=A0A916TAF2_9HYPH|nr:HAD family hydrolase [Roseibium aquae]GGB37653.1 phosphatase [Roseibium aquae]
MPHTIKAILFDKDGTLLDFDATWATPQEAAATWAADGDHRLAADLLVTGGMDPATRKTASGSLFAAGNAAEIARAFIARGAAKDAANLTAKLDEIFANGMKTSVLLPGLKDAVRQLDEAGFRMGVASSDSEASIRLFLERAGLTGYMRFIAGYDSGFGPKPEPGMIHAFAAALRVPVPSIAMVGDNTHDLEMARAAGAGLAVGVLSGTGTRVDLTQLADVILESVADLPGYLSRSGCQPASSMLP